MVKFSKKKSIKKYTKEDATYEKAMIDALTNDKNDDVNLYEMQRSISVLRSIDKFIKNTKKELLISAGITTLPVAVMTAFGTLMETNKINDKLGSLGIVLSFVTGIISLGNVARRQTDHIQALTMKAAYIVDKEGLADILKETKESRDYEYLNDEYKEIGEEIISEADDLEEKYGPTDMNAFVDVFGNKSEKFREENRKIKKDFFN